MLHTVWKIRVKRDHVEFFSVKSNCKNSWNWLLQIHEFLCLKVISMKNESNEFCRVGFTLTFVNNMMFIIFYPKCDFLLPNIGHFQVLVIYEGIHRNQVFWHQKVGQTLLYWYQLRNLAQICAKILHTQFPIDGKG